MRELTNGWAEKTYGELLGTTSLDDGSRRRLLQALDNLGISDRRVVGESVTRLEKTAEGPLRTGISYSRAFELALDEDPEKLPALYLKHLALSNEQATQGTLTGIIARGLRSFPSLLRDRDFAESMMEMAPSFFRVDCEVTINPGLDTKEHTDVFLKLGGETYRIWLYQFTPRGLPHDIERVLGRRGTLPDGIHILCPIKTDVVMSKAILQKRMNALRTRIEKYDRVYWSSLGEKHKIAEDTLEKLPKWRQMMDQTKKLLKKIEPLADAEVESINGWYFCSERKTNDLIQKLDAIISKRSRPDPYSNVCEILRGPEEYLGDIRIFRKGK